MLTYWRSRLREKPLWWHCYVIGFVIVVAGALASYFDRYSLIATSLLSLGMAVGAAGFLAAIAPALVVIWRSPIGLALLAFAHLLVGFVAAIKARHLVANALQLPPHDFDLTVAILALLFYPPLWLAFAAVIATVVGFLGLAMALLLHVPTQLLKPLITPPNEWEARGLRLLMHGAAAMALGMVCVLLTQLVEIDEADLRPAARLIAYAVDYHTVGAYPGVPADQKIRLHENGVVSIARLTGLTVTIEVTSVKLPDEPRSEPPGERSSPWLAR
ncbi:hypothetical protein DFR29_12022 [Tahibacter aquaticus]|uniref:Uncharacterized protein n=1 Tax=Tahibacter aquaticus TaxID=520092 RepID=A0A4R6YM94_9GAMM|nr:hypothetical protein [Tahibacter aquaticus]TDR38521.1 hypothetical protein DFR29_12022 [Tahibacter aquaticus]